MALRCSKEWRLSLALYYYCNSPFRQTIQQCPPLMSSTIRSLSKTCQFLSSYAIFSKLCQRKVVAHISFYISELILADAGVQSALRYEIESPHLEIEVSESPSEYHLRQYGAKVNMYVPFSYMCLIVI